MEINKICGGHLKKFAAAWAGLVIALGGIAAPMTSGSFLSDVTLRAYAEETAEEKTEDKIPDNLNGWTLGTFRSGGHTFTYASKIMSFTELETENNEAFMLIDVEMNDRNLSIPSVVEIDGVKHTVNALYHNFGAGIKAESVTIPETVTDIGDYVFSDASIVSFHMAGGVKYIGQYFCSGVKGLVPFKCTFDTSSLKSISRGGFIGTALDTPNDKGAVMIGNCLLRYTGPDADTLKVADFSDKPIEVIGGDCFIKTSDPDFIYNAKTLDISGVRALSAGSTNHLYFMTDLTGTEDLTYIDGVHTLISTWYFNYHKNDEKVILGNYVFNYKAGEVLDFTSDEFKNVTNTMQYNDHYSFSGLENVKVLKLRKDEPLLSYDMIKDPYQFKNLEEVYIDGKKVECTRAEQFMPGLIKTYYKQIFQRSKFAKTFADDKIKLVFKELGIDYYGLYNDKVGTLSADREFYIVKTLHDYLAKDYYRKNGGTHSIYEIINIGTPAVCQPYAELYAYMLQCAGVDAEVTQSAKLVPAEEYVEPDEGKYVNTYTDKNGKAYALINLHGHSWTLVKVGGNWYHIDISWDSIACENNDPSTYYWFMFTQDFIDNENIKRSAAKYVEVYQGRWVPMGFINTDPYYFYSDLTLFDHVDTDAPYYADVNGDHVRSEEDWKLAQGFCLLGENIKKELLEGKPASDEAKAQMKGIAIYKDEDLKKEDLSNAVPIKMVDDKGDLTFSPKQCDANFDGVVDMSDVLTLRQICSGSCTDPIKELNENADRSDEEFEYHTKELPLFSYQNGEADLDLEQIVDTDSLPALNLGDNRYNILKPEPTPKPAPKPADETTSSDNNNSSSRSETNAERKYNISDDYRTNDSSMPDVKAEDKTDTATAKPDNTKPEDEKAADTAATDGETTADENNTIILGDINGDGNINVSDIALAASHIKGIRALTPQQQKAADITGDGQINVSDIAAISAHIKGINAIRS
ncbi:MAG: hypothetical protein IK999_03785 [Ruminococcus sp.]|nr:hypothetical protein [Ruminococcus sp.]